MNKATAWIKSHAGTILGILVIACVAGLGLTYHRELWAILTRETARKEFIAWVHGSGLAGVGVFLAVQVAQVVVAFLPGEPAELAAGLIYGTFGGLALCLTGILAGSVLVYCTARALGARSVASEALNKYRFLRDDAHIRFALFLLFFIPGTPKDLLIYAGPFLPVRPLHFFLISTLARIPSVLTSTFAAASFAEGSWQAGVAVYAAAGLIAALCVWKEDAILTVLHRRS